MILWALIFITLKSSLIMPCTKCMASLPPSHVKSLQKIVIMAKVSNTAQEAMKDEKIESRLANETRNTRYVFHCSPVVKHR